MRNWEQRYGSGIKVYSGMDCLDAVAQVHECGDADCRGLLDVYLELASVGNWIKMVDIGKLLD